MQQGFFKRNSGSLILFLITFDFAVIMLSGYIAFYIKFQPDLLEPVYYNLAIFFGSLLSISIFIFLNMYQAHRGYNPMLLFKQFVTSWIIIFFMFILCEFLIKDNTLFSREWVILWAATGFILTYLSHCVLYAVLHALRQRGYNQRHVIIIGAGKMGKKMFEKTKSSSWTGFSVDHFYDDDKNKIGNTIENIPINAIPDVFQFETQENEIDEVWICLPLCAESRIKEVMHALRFSTANVRLIPDMFGLNLLNHDIAPLAGTLAITLRQTPMQGINQVIKAIEDRTLALLILLCISPVMLIVAMLVKLTSRGPVFYKQKRVSWNGKEFGMLKFRSMKTNAESQSGAVWAVANDPRTTKLGAWLRKTSLDELPQFINVLKGDMSIVGPRPERPEFISKFKYEIPNYMQKHLVRAGITGLAQVHGLRGNTSLEKRIEYDLNYIQNWSLLLDLKIIFLTIFKGFINKNAY